MPGAGESPLGHGPLGHFDAGDVATGVVISVLDPADLNATSLRPTIVLRWTAEENTVDLATIAIDALIKDLFGNLLATHEVMRAATPRPAYVVTSEANGLNGFDLSITPRFDLPPRSVFALDASGGGLP